MAAPRQVVEDPGISVGRLVVLRRVDGKFAVVDFSRDMLDRTLAVGRSLSGAERWANEYLERETAAGRKGQAEE